MSNVVSFNGVEIPNWVRVTGITFPALPELEVRESTVPRRYGNLDQGVKFGGKRFNLSVILELSAEDNLHDRADELKAWLKGDNWKPSKFTFAEQADKYVMARVSNSVEVEDLFVVGSGEIEFFAADPTKYAMNETSKAGTSAGVSFVYSGLEEAPAVIQVTFTADCSDLTVKHTQTGRSILLRGNFKSGQTALLDSNRKLIQLNGVNAMQLLDFRSKWIYLETGSNTITSSSNTAGVVNNVTVKYRQAD